MFNKLKSVFQSKPAKPIYKNYTPSQLKMIAMKSRIVLEEYYKKCTKAIQEKDKQLSKNKQLSTEVYKILQEIGQKVIQVQSIKIYVALLKKIQDASATIIKTNGDIALMRVQLQWFQAILWFRKSRQFNKLQEINDFCFNFFKGIDITMEINVKCEIFLIYPMLRYLEPNCILPLKKLQLEISDHLQTVLDKKIIEEVFQINKKQLRKWFQRQKVEYSDKFLSKSKTPRKDVVSPHPKHRSPVKTDLMSHSLKPINQINQGYHNQERQSEEEIERRKKQLLFKNSFMRRVNSAKQQKSENQIPLKTLKQVPEKIEEFCSTCNKKVTLVTDDLQKYKEQKRTHSHQIDISNYQLEPSQIPFKVQEHKNQNNLEVLCTKCLSDKQIGDVDQGDQHKQLVQNDQVPQITNAKSDFNTEIQIKNKFLENQIALQSPQPIENDEQPQTYPETKSPRLFREEPQPQKSFPVGVEKKEQIFNDEEQSLEFIRKSIVDPPKKIKKPYMVSIYARAQFVNQIKSN